MQHSLLLAAWVILFAHSVVPHMHEAKDQLQVCATEHHHDSNLLDFLGHVFHFSTGEDHLENYKADSHQLIFNVVSNVEVPRPNEAIYTTFFSGLTLKSQKAKTRYRSLRAPPVYS